MMTAVGPSAYSFGTRRPLSGRGVSTIAKPAGAADSRRQIAPGGPPASPSGIQSVTDSVPALWPNVVSSTPLCPR